MARSNVFDHPIGKLYLGHWVRRWRACSSIFDSMWIPSNRDRCFRHRFPQHDWIVGDMREMSIGREFQAPVAWESFFHLCHDDQRRMFSTNYRTRIRTATAGTVRSGSAKHPAGRMHVNLTQLREAFISVGVGNAPMGDSRRQLTVASYSWC
jgi:hypothetical protein